MVGPGLGGRPLGDAQQAEPGQLGQVDLPQVVVEAPPVVHAPEHQQVPVRQAGDGVAGPVRRQVPCLLALAVLWGACACQPAFTGCMLTMTKCGT